jgi:uncharacterized protein
MSDDGRTSIANSGATLIPQPVVHFEVVGKDPARLRSYFGELFGWEFEVPSPVAKEVSQPESYGFLNTITAEELGGTRVMGPATSPNGLVVGHFRDPEGTLMGVAGVA